MTTAAGDMNAAITAWATVGLAAVTLILVFVTWRAVNTALGDVRESRRARVDASAPRLAFTALDVDRPPLRGDGISTLEKFDDISIHGNADTMVWIGGVIEVVNEGRSTAVLTVPIDAAAGNQDEYRTGGLNSVFTEVQGLAISPGKSRRFMIRSGRPLAEWAALYDRFGTDVESYPEHVIKFVVTDLFADGVDDTTEVGIKGYPTKPLLPEMWASSPALPDARILVHPTVRQYRSDR